MEGAFQPVAHTCPSAVAWNDRFSAVSSGVHRKLDVHSRDCREERVVLLRRLDPDRVGRADADFVRQRTGFAIGGVAPVAHSEPLTILILGLLAIGRSVRRRSAGPLPDVAKLSEAERGKLDAIQSQL